MPTPSSRKISKAEKSLILVCVFVALPLAGLVYLYGGRDAEPNWNIPPASARPNPNGYDFYVAAARARRFFVPPVEPVSETSANRPNSPYALKNYSLARRQQWVKANAKTFALVNQGLSTPSMAPEYVSRSSRDWGYLRELARAIRVRTHTFQIQRLPMRATMSALDTMQMGQDVTRGGGLLARLMGIAIMSVGRDPLEDWNKTINGLSASEARTATQRLERLLAHEPTAAQTILAEKRGQLLELHHTFDTQGWRGPWASQEIMEGIYETSPQIWRRQMTSKQTLYDDKTHFWNTEIASSKLPYSKSKVASPPPGLDVFNQSFELALNRYFMSEARETTNNNMLLLRLALRAYIEEHGTAPLTLAALVPGTLKRIPNDVYNDGKPLFYTPQGKNYRLWSVGPDGINNGGVPLAREANDKPGLPTLNRPDSTGDFVAGLCR